MYYRTGALTPAPDDTAGPGATPGRGQGRENALRIILAADPLAVRRALASILESLSPLDLGPEDTTTVELVLAEVLNNVVEHAYGHDRSGMIELVLLQSGAGLFCTIIDDGCEMPPGMLQGGPAAELPVGPVEGLPEGGFGWVLIRRMSRDLRCTRENGRNRLSFRLALGGLRRTS